MSYQVQIPNVRDTYFAVETEHYQELFWVSLNIPILKKIISSKPLTRRKYSKVKFDLFFETIIMMEDPEY